MRQVSDPGLGSGLVLYVGHFGMPALSIMLYDPTSEQSIFVAFDSALHVARAYAVQSWGHYWQVLVGAFLDHSACGQASSCAQLDDVLALNRATGQIEQFAFTFGNRYQVFDNRLASFLREGVIPASSPHLHVVDTPRLTLTATLDVGITDQEVY